jgi:SAM-dependent methyltransferase
LKTLSPGIDDGRAAQLSPGNDAGAERKRGLFYALARDLAQRVLTANKADQRRQLGDYLSRQPWRANACVLDFGCGTGLFTPAFRELRLKSVGYDIDPRSVKLAAKLYPYARFTACKEQLEAWAPFDLILANCCTHHIPDQELKRELVWCESLLHPSGVFILVDIFKTDETRNWLHRQYMKMEEGTHVRSLQDSRDLLESIFRVDDVTTWRSYLFSCESRLNPISNDLAVIRCHRRTGRGLR